MHDVVHDVMLDVMHDAMHHVMRDAINYVAERCLFGGGKVTQVLLLAMPPHLHLVAIVVAIVLLRTPS